jgi:hypothetical protein
MDDRFKEKPGVNFYISIIFFSKYSLLKEHQFMNNLSTVCSAASGYPRLRTRRDSGPRAMICILHRTPYLDHNINRLRITRTRVCDVYNIAALDSAPEWTLDQIAGLVFASLLVTLYFSSKIVDEYVASSQRIELGICQKCGGLKDKKTCQEKECPFRT